jgi:hypothetical protein
MRPDVWVVGRDTGGGHAAGAVDDKEGMHVGSGDMPAEQSWGVQEVLHAWHAHSTNDKCNNTKTGRSVPEHGVVTDGSNVARAACFERDAHRTLPSMLPLLHGAPCPAMHAKTTRAPAGRLARASGNTPAWE